MNISFFEGFFLLKNMREKIILVCSECQSRNYAVSKKIGSQNRLSVNKYCKKCGKHTLHKEGK